MEIKIENIFSTDGIQRNEESFFSLFSNEDVLIEKIVSFGQPTKTSEWYDQEKDEWVALLQGEAELLFETNNNKVQLKKGDYILIPAHERHRVIYTSAEPPCIWLAIHFTKNGG